MDFAKSIENAQKLPAGSEASPRDVFAPPTPGSFAQPIAQVADSPEAIPGTAAYDLSYHAERFFMGRELAEVTEDGAKIYQDRDESARLKEVMDKVLRGEAVIVARIQQILSDGSVVVFVEWTTKAPKKKVPREERDHLTLGELTSPKRLTPRSKGADKKAGEPRNLLDEEDDEEQAELKGELRAPHLPAAPSVDYDEDAGGEAANAEPDWGLPEPTPDQT